MSELDNFAGHIIVNFVSFLRFMELIFPNAVRDEKSISLRSNWGKNMVLVVTALKGAKENGLSYELSPNGFFKQEIEYTINGLNIASFPLGMYHYR